MRTADLPGLKNRYLIDSADTDGRFALIEHTIPAAHAGCADAHA
jgi:hypothetical protein